MSKDRITNPVPSLDDVKSDAILRPRKLDEFVGQEELKSNLRVFVAAAKQRGEPLDHVLLYGPPGLGKTTLAHIIANELEVPIKVTSGPVFQNAAELLGVLSHIETNQTVFIDEIHRLPRVLEEHLYQAMDSLKCELVVDKGPNARHYTLNLEPFTLVGATTRAGMITAPLRERFGVVFRLDYYAPAELRIIVERSARILGIDITPDGADEIARRSRGTPRIANRLLKRTRDFAQVKGKNVIDREASDYALERLRVDARGLDEMDRRILKLIVEQFGGGPVGINSLAVAVGEEPDTLEEVYEPYLIMEGYLNRTPQGRVATELSYKKLGLKTATGAQPRLL